MTKKKICVLSQIIIGTAIILYGVFMPPEPKSAWWGTAFSIVCKEAVDDNPEKDGAGVELRWLIKDIADRLARKGKN